MNTCGVCKGSGEVPAGIQWVDQHGEIQIRKNPAAEVTIETGNKSTDFLGAYIVSPNPLVPLWGIAICGICHGCGIEYFA